MKEPQLISMSENVGFCYESEDVTNSKYVYKSKNVADSLQVSESENVSDSSIILESTEVSNSDHIIDSENVADSSVVIRSKNIGDCRNIVGANVCRFCNDLLVCDNMEDSSFCYGSSFGTDCHFSSFLKDCVMCLFCSGLVEETSMIFNKKVSYKRFMEVKEQLNSCLNNNDFSYIRPRHDSLMEFLDTKRYYAEDLYANLSAEFLGWVGSLEEYDEKVFFSWYFTRKKG